MNLCVTLEGSPRVNALPSSSSSTWPEMSNKSNPVSLLPHLVWMCVYVWVLYCVDVCVCVCVDFVMYGCVCMCGLCNVWVCVYVWAL